MERSEVSVLVALDLSSAFDTVNHSILLDVLEKDFSVTDNALQWTASYLKDRKFKVKVGRDTSDTHIFNYSVPQGSCLGPILFNVYSSTIVDCISDTQSLGGYADDHYLKGLFVPSKAGDESTCIDNIEKTLTRRT
jgi:retron-type reverse transcriptase